MSVDILKKQIKSGGFSNIYYFYASERYLEEFYFERLINMLLPERDDFNYIEFDEVRDYNQIYEIVTSFSFTGDKKVCVIKDYNINSFSDSDEDMLEKIFSDINENCILIFKQEELIPDGRKAKPKKFKALIEKHEGVCCEFKKMSAGELAAWIIRRVRAERKNISRDNAQYLIEYCSEDMNTLLCEILKLVSYSSVDEINKNHINSVCIKSLSARTFELADEIIKKNSDKAFMLINELFDMKYEAIIIAASVYKAFCDLYGVKVLYEKGYSSAEISKSLGIMQFVVNKHINIAGSKNKKYFINALDICYRTDISLKSSRIDSQVLIQKMAGELLNI